ncbi:MAG TPA: hypothetical protein VEC60_04400 [Reyranella sp.]|nr:hypothetical protein [Reyranella sp.]
MAKPMFIKLNKDWNAEPNAPFEEVELAQPDVILRFYLNHRRFTQFGPSDVGVLTFSRCSRWRLGIENMDAFALRQPSSRYCQVAPAWGEFYEILGEDTLRDAPDDWSAVSAETEDARHFLFYLRDNTFECIAQNWAFTVETPA